MVYRISQEEVFKFQENFKKNYKPFRPFRVPSEAKAHVGELFSTIISTQNGQDSDDYCVTDENDKVSRYLSHLPKGSKVLLHGVGTGRETLAAKSLGFEVVGTTLGSRNIDCGIEFLGLTADEHMEVLSESLPFPREYFDVVAGFQIFEHATAPLLFLLEQSRVLKMGGKLYLEWPPAIHHTMDDNPHHQICYVPGQARGLLLKAGFSDIKMYYDDLSPIPETDWWKSEEKEDRMMCIEGTKVPVGKDYIKRAWNLR